MRHFARSRFAVLLAVVLFAPRAYAQGRPPLVIRVGVGEYQNIERTYQKYVGLFRELASASRASEPVTFTIAVGNYTELSNWYIRKMIDLAVVPAMPAAQFISVMPQGALANFKDSYLGTIAERAGGTPGGQSTLSSLFPQNDDMAAARAGYGADYFYRTTAVVLDQPGQLSPLHSVKDLSDPRYVSRIKYIFVRPYSISGFVLPVHFLAANGIRTDGISYDFSYQHRASLQRLVHPFPGEDDGKLLVAFVLDSTVYQSRSGVHFRRLEGASELEAARIPYNALVVNQLLDETQRRNYKRVLSGLIERRQAQETTQSTIRFKVFPPDEWMRSYDSTRQWLQEADLPRELQYKSTFDDILTDIRAYQSAGKVPRLALVLSGGGAKCSYQAGAIEAIERRLAEERKRPGSENLDINLVVGTSGGSINALLVALGITRSDTGRGGLEHTWSSFRQQDFFKPAGTFNFVFGMSLGILQAFILTAASLLFGRSVIQWFSLVVVLTLLGMVELVLGRLSGARLPVILEAITTEMVCVLLLLLLIRLLRRRWKDWWRIAGWSMVVVSLGEVVAAKMQEPLWLQNTLPNSHLVHHIWPLISLIGLWCFPWPLLLGLAMVASGRKRIPAVDWHEQHRVMNWIMVASVAIFLWYVLWIGSALSSTTGVQQALADEVPGLLKLQGVNVSSDPFQDVPARLEDISGQIVAHPTELIQRDLVITASRLPAPVSPHHQPVSANSLPPFEANLLPQDLYFYYDSNAGTHTQPPAQEPRFISLRQNPTKLLQVVVGSSTIYPVFSPQALEGLTLGRSGHPGRKVETIKVVDGGFIHNSPIEAAYLWGATHIIVIEASPASPPKEPRNFLQSAAQAASFLFAQAQRIDTLSKGAVEMFELRPTSQCERQEAHHDCDATPDPDMDVFDFGKVPVMHALSVGRNDVSPDNSSTPARPLFVRIPGPPVFRGLN